MHKIARCLMLFYGFLRIAISTDDLEGSLPLILFSGPNFSGSTRPCVCHKYIHVSFPVKIQSRHFGSLSRHTGTCGGAGFAIRMHILERFGRTIPNLFRVC